MQSANIPMLSGLMERIPGSPPTPIAEALTENAVLRTPATQDPAMAEKNGKTYFRLIPNIAGSVTPR